MNGGNLISITAPLSQMWAQWAGSSDIGRMRDHQEDAFTLPTASSPAVYDRGLLLVVADGVGGRQAGDEASRLAVAIIDRTFVDQWTPDIGYSLVQAIQQANAQIYQRGQESDFRGMATTVVCTVVRNDQLYVAHVGDSRAYRLRGGALQLLTQDHSWVQTQIMLGVLTEEEARTHSKRHIVTRSLGLAPTVEVELTRHALRHGDRLLLCSDGLYDLVPDAEIAAALTLPPSEACTELIRRANEAGGSDNITVAVAVISLPDELAETPFDNALDDESTAAHPVIYLAGDEDATAERPVMTVA